MIEEKMWVEIYWWYDYIEIIIWIYLNFKILAFYRIANEQKTF